jgi:DNA adenine methylase
MKTCALANWFGANRTNAGLPGKLLAGCACVCVGFAGGMCELPYIDARQRTANDLHRHVVNLARVVADPALYTEMRANIEGSIYHPDTLAAAQRRCSYLETACDTTLFADGRLLDESPSVVWASDYFVASWMAPGGRSGMDDEFGQSLSFRFTASGGGSSVRFWSAFDSLPAWHKSLRGWEFTTLDIFEFLGKCQDRKDAGLYLDPPWVEKRGEYKHDFTEHKHRELARVVNGYESMRVVMRYGDHPLVRELYCGGRWHYLELSSRNQGNNDVREVVITNFQASEVA